MACDSTCTHVKVSIACCNTSASAAQAPSLTPAGSSWELTHLVRASKVGAAARVGVAKHAARGVQAGGGPAGLRLGDVRGVAFSLTHALERRKSETSTKTREKNSTKSSTTDQHNRRARRADKLHKYICAYHQRHGGGRGVCHARAAGAGGVARVRQVPHPCAKHQDQHTESGIACGTASGSHQHHQDQNQDQHQHQHSTTHSALRQRGPP